MTDEKWLDGYLLSKPGAEKDYKVEWEWLRYRVREKQFAARLCPSERYDPLYAGKQLLSLKCDPAQAEFWRAQYPWVLPGFYIDKRTWNSIDLGADPEPELLMHMIDESYRLVVEKLPKRVQKELLDSNGK